MENHHPPMPPEAAESSNSRLQRTLRLYQVYIGLNLIWYALIFILGVISFQIVLPQDPELANADGVLKVSGVILILIGALFFLLTLLTSKPKLNQAGWMTAFINICLGITSCILTPFCIYLAIQWNHPEFKSEFLQQEFQL